MRVLILIAAAVLFGCGRRASPKPDEHYRDGSDLSAGNARLGQSELGATEIDPGPRMVTLAMARTHLL